MKLSEVKLALVQTARLLASEPALLAKVQSDIAAVLGDITHKSGTGESVVSVKASADGKKFVYTDKRSLMKWEVPTGAKQALHAKEMITQTAEVSLGIAVKWDSFPKEVQAWIDEERKRLTPAPAPTPE